MDVGTATESGGPNAIAPSSSSPQQCSAPPAIRHVWPWPAAIGVAGGDALESRPGPRQHRSVRARLGGGRRPRPDLTFVVLAPTDQPATLVYPAGVLAAGSERDHRRTDGDDLRAVRHLPGRVGTE